MANRSSNIKINPEHEGLFTREAQAHNESVQEYARQVLADPNASPALKKRANFARNAAKFKH